MECFIGIDMGTSSAKGVLLTEDGKILKIATEKFRYITKGEAQFLDPDEYCEAIYKVISELAKDAGEGNHIAAICSCCAAGNLVLLDNEAKPITPIISWQTRIPQEDLDAVYPKELQERFYDIVGWPLEIDMPSAYLAWMKLHKPELLDAAKIVTMNCELLNYRLTGEWGISHSMGTEFCIIDQVKGEYSDELCELLGVKGKILPPIYDKGHVLGTVTPKMAKKLGLPDDTKIVLGTFDHPSGAMGAGVFEDGELLLSCGTSWVEFFPINDRKAGLKTGGYVDRFCLHGAPYYVLLALDSITDKINSLKKIFFRGITFAEFDAIAEKATLGCNGLRFNFDDDDEKLAENHETCDVARAIYESAALLLKENLEHLKECGLNVKTIKIVGGITNSDVCCNIISETLGIELQTCNGQHAGAVGAALLAGMGAGKYATEKEAFEVFINNNN